MESRDAGINGLRIACPQKLIEVELGGHAAGELLGEGGMAGNPCRSRMPPVALCIDPG